MAIEAVLFELGKVAVRTAAKLWLGEQKVAAEVAGSAVDQLFGRLSADRDKRKLGRLLDDFADEVVARLEPVIDTEFRGLPEHERLAAVLAARDAFDEAALDDADLFASDLDARHLDRAMRRKVAKPADGLSQSGTALFDLLLRECCGYVIEIARGLPRFTPNALTEVLRRQTEVLAEVREAIARLPQRRRGDGFDYDYRQLVARTLDHVEMFGATLSEASRRYPLSVAYISLTAAGGSEQQRIEELLAPNRRVFVRGEAGLGKTTLLQWIAVRSAREDFTGAVGDWNGSMPFFVPLRRYADRELPTPGRFLDEVGRHIADDMPDGWAQQHLRSGKAVLLVDGVDELAADRRDEVRQWLRALVTAFPRARYVITSRPSATLPDWLNAELFTVLDLQPMTPEDVRIFIERWHTAMRGECLDEPARRELDSFQRTMVEQLETRRHLRQLARLPLLCALLCALNRDRRAALPDNRMELYDVALQMLLERLDAERRIPSLPGLGRTEKTLLLGDLAYWFIRNGISYADTDRVRHRLTQRLGAMPQIDLPGESVYRYLLERTGLLREPVDGQVDFVHRTFQEYLAARSAVADSDDIGMIVRNAHSDQWQDMVVLAAGHATTAQRKELLQGLLRRGDQDREVKDTMHLLALACLETVPELDPLLWTEIKDRAKRLVPPTSEAAMKAVAAAGGLALDLLATVKPDTPSDTVNLIRALARTGRDEALPMIARFSPQTDAGVQEELVHSWSLFDADIYARQVLAKSPATRVALRDLSRLGALRLLPNLRELDLSSDGDTAVEVELPRQVTGLRLTGRWTIRLEDGTGLRDLELLVGRMNTTFDLASVAGATGLRSLRSVAVRLFNLSEFAGRDWELVELHNAVRMHDLSDIGTRWKVKRLHLTGVPGLIAPEQLDLADGLTSLWLAACPDLWRLTGLARWADTLETLYLRPDSALDLSNPDVLEQLHRLPRLRSLRITSDRPVRTDLLPSRTGLTVQVNDKVLPAPG